LSSFTQRDIYVIVVLNKVFLIILTSVRINFSLQASMSNGMLEKGLEVWLKQKNTCFGSMRPLSSNHSTTKTNKQKKTERKKEEAGEREDREIWAFILMLGGPFHIVLSFSAINCCPLVPSGLGVVMESH
jgi:hypothetical protein